MVRQNMSTYSGFTFGGLIVHDVAKIELHRMSFASLGIATGLEGKVYNQSVKQPSCHF